MKYRVLFTAGLLLGLVLPPPSATAQSLANLPSATSATGRTVPCTVPGTPGSTQACTVPQVAPLQSVAGLQGNPTAADVRAAVPTAAANITDLAAGRAPLLTGDAASARAAIGAIDGTGYVTTGTVQTITQRKTFSEYPFFTKGILGAGSQAGPYLPRIYTFGAWAPKGSLKSGSPLDAMNDNRMSMIGERGGSITPTNTTAAIAAALVNPAAAATGSLSVANGTPVTLQYRCGTSCTDFTTGFSANYFGFAVGKNNTTTSTGNAVVQLSTDNCATYSGTTYTANFTGADDEGFYLTPNVTATALTGVNCTQITITATDTSPVIVGQVGLYPLGGRDFSRPTAAGGWIAGSWFWQTPAATARYWQTFVQGGVTQADFGLTSTGDVALGYYSGGTRAGNALTCAAGTGVCTFPQGAKLSATSDPLTTYTASTATSLSTTGSTGGTATTPSAVGRYSRIGPMVTVSQNTGPITTGTCTGNLQFQLPFANGPVPTTIAAMGSNFSMPSLSNGSYLVLYIPANSSFGLIGIGKTTGALSFVQCNDLTSGSTTFGWSGPYFTS